MIARGIPDTLLNAPTLTSHGARYGHLLELGPVDPGRLDRPSRIPGVLSEALFLTDVSEADVMESRVGQEVLARAFSADVNRYFHSSGIAGDSRSNARATATSIANQAG